VLQDLRTRLIGAKLECIELRQETLLHARGIGHLVRHRRQTSPRRPEPVSLVLARLADVQVLAERGFRFGAQFTG
jgi:hypothetical protein